MDNQTRTDADRQIEHWLEEHRIELGAHCRRMLWSAFDADDAVQETLVRAWRAFDRFEGRGSREAWLRRIATNVCLDMLDASRRRAIPIDISTSPETPHVRQSIRGGHSLPIGDDPADRAVEREAILHAFVAAVIHLAPRQRAVLILCEVLRWRVADVAELLDTTVPAVNSALQRARSNLADRDRTTDAQPTPAELGVVARRQFDAFVRYDVDSLVALLLADESVDAPTAPPSASRGCVAMRRRTGCSGERRGTRIPL